MARARISTHSACPDQSIPMPLGLQEAAGLRLSQALAQATRVHFLGPQPAHERQHYGIRSRDQGP